MNERTIGYVVIFLRVFFGTHSLWSGLNHFFEFTPPMIPKHPVAGAFVMVMMQAGLFDLIKVVEVVVGICLLTNRFVPLALAAEFPSTLSIFWLDAIVVHTPRLIYVGSRELLLNLILLMFYFGYYKAILTLYADIKPIWNSARQRHVNSSGGN